MYDNAGKHLFTLLKQPLHIHTTFEGRDPTSDQALFTVKSSFSFGTKLTAYALLLLHAMPTPHADPTIARGRSYQNTTTGRAEQLELRGDWFDRKAEITLGGVPVGRISRQFMNAGQMLFDQQTYILTVAPGGTSTVTFSTNSCGLTRLRVQWTPRCLQRSASA